LKIYENSNKKDEIKFILSKIDENINTNIRYYIDELNKFKHNEIFAYMNSQSTIEYLPANLE
jgi:hypothetical protein